MAIQTRKMLVLLALLLATYLHGVTADRDCWAEACIDNEDCEDRDCEFLTGRTKYVTTNVGNLCAARAL